MNTSEIAATLQLFDAAPCAYLFTLPDGTITTANETFLQWTGYAASELLHRKRFQDLLTRPSAIFYETHFAPLLHMQGWIREIAVDMKRADGSRLPVLVNSQLYRDADGDASLVLTSLFDMTERRRYEQELLSERRKAEQWAVVVEQASDAIIFADAQGNVTAWNHAAERLFGYSRQEALGRGFRELIVAQDHSEDFDRQVSALSAGASIQYETLLRSKEGTILSAAVSLTAHVEPVDEYHGFSAIIRDIGARRKMEQAQRMSRDLELASRLAHEINNPLQAAVNCMALISHSGDSQYVETAQANLDRIANVIKQLAAITRGS